MRQPLRRTQSALSALAFAVGTVRAADAQAIRTFAGGGSIDGRPAIAVNFYAPGGVALDASGNVYLADPDANQVRRVDVATGKIFTVAGNGGQGFGGDNGPASAATLNGPQAVAIDAKGDVFISDTGNGRIRRIEAVTGFIRPVAGGGVPSDYVGDGGPATGAAFASPWGLAFDKGGDLWIGDLGGHRVRKIAMKTGLISTVAGTGERGFSGDGGPATSAQFDRPIGVALDAAGNLYVSDAANNRVRRVDAGTGKISTIAGNGTADFGGDGGPATAAGLAYPSALTLDPTGALLYFSDTFHYRIRRLTLATGFVGTVAGDGSWGTSGDGGPATAASVSGPWGLTVDPGGNLYIAHEADLDGRIRKVSASSGLISTIAGGGYYDGDGGPALSALLREPSGLASDAQGNLFVADSAHLRVRKISASTGAISTPAGDGNFYNLGPDGSPATSVSVGVPRDVAIDPQGNVYIADALNDRVYKVDTSGRLSLVAGGGQPADQLGDGLPGPAAQLHGASGVALDAGGNVLIADSNSHRIRRVDAQTRIVTTVAGSGPFAGGAPGDFGGDSGPATAARLANPEGVRVDAAGNIFIADTLNSAVRKVTPNGTILTVAGRGNPPQGVGDGGPATAAALSYPRKLAFDAAGNLLIADAGNHAIRKVSTTSGVISTIAGNGNRGFSGDRGAATAAQLNGPRGLAVDAAGNLYIGDTANNRVRVVPAGTSCPLPTITSQPADQTVVTGLAAVLSVSATGTGLLSYQWYRGATGDTGSPVAGATSGSFTTQPLTATASFWVRVTDTCGSADSATATAAVTSVLADLSLSMSASPDPVPVGGRLTYTLTARNDGPTPATVVTVSDALPPGVTFVSASASQGACSGTSAVTCALGSLVQGAAATVTIAVNAGGTGTLTNRARVSAAEFDPNTDNNSAVSFTTVSPADSADLLLLQGHSPEPPRAGSPLTYNLFVRNNGPANATNVALTDTLPAGAAFVSASATQGTCSGTGPVTCTLVALARGASANVTLVVTPPAPGTFANAARVTGTEADPNAANNAFTETVTVLSNAPACPASPPDIVSSPSGVVRAGDSFTVSWSDVYGPTDPEGTYRAQLSASSDFGTASLLSEIRTRNLSLSFPTPAGTTVTYSFRVSSLAGCGKESGPSRTVAVNIAPNPPSLVVSSQQTPEWVFRVNGTAAPGTIRFRNVGGSSVPVQFVPSGGFFTFSPAAANLGAGQEVEVTLQLLPDSTSKGGSFSGSLTASWPQGSVSASVYLTVTDTESTGVKPSVDQDEVLIVGKPRGGTRAKGARPLAVTTFNVTNRGGVPIFLVPSVNPGGAWLRLDPADFGTPLPPGQTRAIRLDTDPARISPADYPLPIWTVLTISAAGGSQEDRTEVKVFYSEESAVLDGSGRGFLGAGASSFIVPTGVHKEGLGGTVFSSDGWIRNLSPDPVAIQVFAAPSGQDGQAGALRVDQSIPPFATLRLFDFVQGLFGTTDLAAHVEVRSRDFGQLSIRITASGLPGTGDVSSRFGTEIPVYGSGTGTGAGLPPLVLTGIKVNDVPDGYRLNLILAETVGAPETVRIRLFDSTGSELASKEVAVPASGNTQFRLLDLLGLTGAKVASGSVFVEPVSGTGRVAAIGTLVDNASASFQALSGRVVPPQAGAAARAGAADPIPPRVIPSIVHSKGKQGTFFTTELAITNGTLTPAPLHLVYTYSGSDGAGNGISGTATADVTLGPRASLAAAQARDAIVNLFGLPPDSNTSGPLRIEGTGVGRIVGRATVTTPVDPNDSAKGTKGAEFQSYSAVSPEAVGVGKTPVAIYPGLQKYPGIRTNLILAEVTGQSARVRVRAINGTTGGVLAELERTLGPFQQTQITDIWNGGGGFGLGDASYDRVAISLEPLGSDPGRVVGALSVIDNNTASPRILVLAPPGPPDTSSIGF